MTTTAVEEKADVRAGEAETNDSYRERHERQAATDTENLADARAALEVLKEVPVLLGNSGDADGDLIAENIQTFCLQNTTECWNALTRCLGGPGDRADGPGCEIFDFDADSDLDLGDIGRFHRLFDGL